MKKLILIAIVVLLSAISAVYAQQKINVPQGMDNFSVGVIGNNTLRLRMGVEGMMAELNFEGKLNGKSIELRQEGFSSISMNDGALSDEETSLVVNAIDVMKSVFKRDKFEAPGMSFKLGVQEAALLADVRSGAAVLEGKIKVTLNRKPVEFKSDARSGVVLYDSGLSDNEIKTIEVGFDWLKSFIAKGK